MLQQVYNMFVRGFLPTKVVVWNGVAVRRGRLLDTTDAHPDVKAAQTDAIETYVGPEDHVVMLGGGWGVTAVHAAIQCSTLTIVEAAEQRCAEVEDTLALNDTGAYGDIDIRHRTVGHPIDVWGAENESLAVSELPECDFLECDVEGSELSIIPALEIEPDVISLECHPDASATESWGRNALRKIGYEVVDRSEQERGNAIVLIAERD